ncbi:MAG: sugar transporter [Proteobacteria bacterium]|nr:MAG: sugar transporter [Pseudomonadota bacterium]PIE67485.1 MAG: sugar transporter [Deltaproteobacteria bacterium]
MLPLLWVITTLVITTVPAAHADGAEAGYRIGPGDVLDISVWKNPDLTRKVTVLPDGTISFPLIEQMRAADKTVNQLSKEMGTRLSRFVPDVDLSIIIAQVNSQVIYVIGRVNHPGRFAMSAPLNVMQALATAGGLTPFAKADKIKIFREAGDEESYLPFDYEKVSKGERREQNVRLQRGDVIVVP